MTKTCTKCGETKELSEFYNNKVHEDGKCYYCKACSNMKHREYRERKNKEDPNFYRKNHLKTRYNITIEVFEEMKSKQEGACAICGIVPDKMLYVDHCHNTGDVRGLLCNSCNVALGHFKDNPNLMRAGAEYVESNK